MYNSRENTKLSLTHGGYTMTWEGEPGADLTQILDGFIGCLRGVTFGEWVVSAIKEYCDDYLMETGQVDHADLPLPQYEDYDYVSSPDYDIYEEPAEDGAEESKEPAGAED